MKISFLIVSFGRAIYFILKHNMACVFNRVSEFFRLFQKESYIQICDNLVIAFCCKLIWDIKSTKIVFRQFHVCTFNEIYCIESLEIQFS